jgi:predicted double-glycine peptidase
MSSILLHERAFSRPLLAGALGALVAGGLSACALPPPAPMEGNWLAVGGGRSIDVPVVTMREQKWESIVRQQLDFSCGAAAVATLLQYHYQDEVQEREIIEYMLVNGDQDRIRQQGFSLLDIQTYVTQRGYQAQGYKIPAEMLERLANPAITLVTTRGYSHFVVLRGARDGYVYLADPAIGRRSMRLDEFEGEWQGVVFFVAAQRNGSDPSPLAQLGGMAGPANLVRRLDSVGLSRVAVTGPLEFQF